MTRSNSVSVNVAQPTATSVYLNATGATSGPYNNTYPFYMYVQPAINGLKLYPVLDGQVGVDPIATTGTDGSAIMNITFPSAGVHTIAVKDNISGKVSNAVTMNLTDPAFGAVPASMSAYGNSNGVNKTTGSNVELWRFDVLCKDSAGNPIPNTQVFPMVDGVAHPELSVATDMNGVAIFLSGENVHTLFATAGTHTVVAVSKGNQSVKSNAITCTYNVYAIQMIVSKIASSRYQIQGKLTLNGAPAVMSDYTIWGDPSHSYTFKWGFNPVTSAFAYAATPSANLGATSASTGLTAAPQTSNGFDYSIIELGAGLNYQLIAGYGTQRTIYATFTVTGEAPPNPAAYTVDVSMDKTSFPVNTYVTITMTVRNKSTGAVAPGVTIFPAFDGVDPSGTPAWPGVTDANGQLVVKSLGTDYGGRMLAGSHVYYAVVLSNNSSIPHSWSPGLPYTGQPAINSKLQWQIKDSKGSVVPGAVADLLVYFGQNYYQATLTADSSGYMSWNIPTGYTCNSPYPNGALTVRENAQVYQNYMEKIAAPCSVQVVTCLAKSTAPQILIGGIDAKANSVAMAQGRAGYTVKVTGLRPGAVAIISFAGPVGSGNPGWYTQWARYPYSNGYFSAPVDDTGVATFTIVNRNPGQESTFDTYYIPSAGAWTVTVKDAGYIYDANGGVFSPSRGSYGDYSLNNTNLTGGLGPTISATLNVVKPTSIGLPVAKVTLPTKTITINGVSKKVVVLPPPHKSTDRTYYDGDAPATSLSMQGVFTASQFALTLYDPSLLNNNTGKPGTGYVLFPYYYQAYLVGDPLFTTDQNGASSPSFGISLTRANSGSNFSISKEFVDGQSGWDKVFWLNVELRDNVLGGTSSLNLVDPPSNASQPAKDAYTYGAKAVFAIPCIVQEGSFILADWTQDATGGSTTSSGGSTSTGGGSTSGGTTYTGPTSYPVTIYSNPTLILQAFKDCGYYYQLSADYQTLAANDPATWLGNHPYLYTSYPAYFKAP